MIQIVGINAKTLLELWFQCWNGPRVNLRVSAARREKGGVRIAEAAFEACKTGILVHPRFTAR